MFFVIIMFVSRTAIKRRTDFEYKLQKRIVTKQDILSYIEVTLYCYLFSVVKPTQIHSIKFVADIV